MKICLYKCTAEPNRVDKKSYLSTPFPIDGTLTLDCSMTDPIIELEKTNPIYYQYNYLYIPDFKRFYFITNWLNVANNLWQLQAHVDVLYTYVNEIYASSAIATKAENRSVSSDEIDDGSYIPEVPTQIRTYTFENSFNEISGVLVVAGIIPGLGG